MSGEILGVVAQAHQSAIFLMWWLRPFSHLPGRLKQESSTHHAYLIVFVCTCARSGYCGQPSMTLLLHLRLSLVLWFHLTFVHWKTG